MTQRVKIISRGSIMQASNSTTRRNALIHASGTLAAAALPPNIFAANQNYPIKPKKVAAIASTYYQGSHADVILGKIMEGWRQDGGPGPALQLSSVFVEQIGLSDISVATCKRNNVPMFDSITGAITCGTDGIPVDGIISIGEHGDYPWNERGQHLYPRKRFFEEITSVLEKYKTRIPVFNDKHLGPEWDDAKWMYQRAKQLRLPLMAGSSLPVSFRKPDTTIEMNAPIEAAVGIGYDGLDIYASHALDSLQSVIERRGGAKTGVKWVQFLEGDEVDRVFNDGLVDRQLFEAALAVVPKVSRELDEKLAPPRSVILFQCEDGFLGVQFMLQSVIRTAVAVKLKGRQEPLAMQFEERAEPKHPHFAYLTKAIERMMHQGTPSYPVERTYLTSGILDRAIRSWNANGQRFHTPELSIQYKPVAYPHAPLPSLQSDPRLPLSKVS